MGSVGEILLPPSPTCPHLYQNSTLSAVSYTCFVQRYPAIFRLTPYQPELPGRPCAFPLSILHSLTFNLCSSTCPSPRSKKFPLRLVRFYFLLTLLDVLVLLQSRTRDYFRAYSSTSLFPFSLLGFVCVLSLSIWSTVTHFRFIQRTANAKDEKTLIRSSINLPFFFCFHFFLWAPPKWRRSPRFLICRPPSLFPTLPPWSLTSSSYLPLPKHATKKQNRKASITRNQPDIRTTCITDLFHYILPSSLSLSSLLFSCFSPPGLILPIPFSG